MSYDIVMIDIQTNSLFNVWFGLKCNLNFIECHKRLTLKCVGKAVQNSLYFVNLWENIFVHH